MDEETGESYDTSYGGCFHIIIEKYDFPMLPTEEEKEMERICRVAEKVLEPI